MTAWQDLPPQTRRQARMNERGGKPPASAGHAQNQHAQNQSETIAHTEENVFIGFPREEHHSDAAAGYGRRARRSAEPADRSVPSTTPPSSPAAATHEPVDGDALANDAGASEAATSGYRMRDFSPESRGPSFTMTRNPMPAAGHKPEGPTRQIPQWTPQGQDDSGDLRYYTQGVPLSSGLPAAPPPVVVARVPVALAPPPRALTRRQLRELETSRGMRPEATDGPQEPVADASASLVQPVSLAPTVALPTVPGVGPASPFTPPVFTDPPAVTSIAPVRVAAEPIAPAPVTPEPVTPELVAPVLVMPEPVASAPAVPTLVAPSLSVPVHPAPVHPAATVPDFATDRGIDLAPQVFAAPAGHWSTPASAGESAPSGAAFIRSVGTTSGALTTSALVIPSVPQASDMTRPFGSTGEILVTGSIDLPRSLGTTGALPARFDHSDIDALFAAEDNDYASSDSAPVRAIRAVSTHTSTHGVISAKKPANNKLPMMMAVTAGILAVAVAALFVAALVFDYL